MDIPVKYEDVVAKLEDERTRVTDYIAQRAQTELQLDAALGREAALQASLDAVTFNLDKTDKVALALREELDLLKPTFESTFDAAQRDRTERDDLQHRLTVAEQRAGELEALLPNAELALKALNVAVSVYDVELADNARRGLRELIAALKPAAEGEGS